MTFKIKSFGLMVLLLFLALPALADDGAFPERSIGKKDAPIKVDEFISLTCTHCAHFYNDILPDLEKKYVDTGKVRIVMHDFPLDGLGLKIAALARCMPEDEYFPFVKVLYKNQMNWVASSDAEKIVTQYAKLGGLAEDKAKACLLDSKMQDQVVAERTDAQQKYSIASTPTFVINNGTEKIEGAQPVEKFSAIFDKILGVSTPQVAKTSK